MTGRLAGWFEERAIWTVAILGLALLLGGDWIMPLIDRDEPRFAEASREMRQRGDYILPRFNGDYRFDKPPLIYWCQVASYDLFGESAFAARLPSAIFATGTAILLALWGRRLGNARTGFYAALMFLCCPLLLIYGRLAMADMPMVFFFTVAVWGGWEMSRKPAAVGWWWMFYGSLALGFLAKGPEAWLPLAGVWIAGRRTPPRALWGFALTLGIVALWGVPALILTHGEFFRIGIGLHVIHRSFGVMEGHGFGGWRYIALLPFFFVTSFLGFLPWSLWFPGAWRHWHRDELGTFLLIQAALVFGVFTIVATKLPHYTLPALPCVALWLGLQMSGQPNAPARIVWGMAAMAAVVFAAIIGGQFAGSPFLSARLWQEAQPFIRPETRVATVEFNEPSLVWEFRRATTNYVEFLPLAQAAAFLRGPAPRCLILPTKDWDAGRWMVPTNAVILRAQGTDTASFHHWDMTAVALP